MTFHQRPVFWLIPLVLLGVIFAAFFSANSSPQKRDNIASVCDSTVLRHTVDLPGGMVTIGSNAAYPEEAPANERYIEPFNLDAHEVTNAQFAEFIDATGYVTSAERATQLGFEANGSAVFRAAGWQFIAGADWRQPEGPNSTYNPLEPVVHVSREDAMAYAEWLGRRLPTEAEFEYAARSGNFETRYAWGEELTPGGQYMANTWQGAFPVADVASDGFSGRAPVGCFPPNKFGLYDMIGNVWEWTSSPYYPQHNIEPETQAADNGQGFDPRQPGLPVGVLKGGSYLCAENYCRRYRPSARHAQDLELGTNHIGFRTASDL